MNKNYIKIFRLFLISALLFSTLNFSAGSGIDAGQSNTKCITEVLSVTVSFSFLQKNQNESKELNQQKLISGCSMLDAEQLEVISERYNSDIKLKIIYTTFLNSHFATST